MGETSPIIVKIGQVAGGKKTEPEYNEPVAEAKASAAAEFQVRTEETQLMAPRTSAGRVPRKYSQRRTRPADFRHTHYRDRRGSTDFPSAPAAQTKWWWSLPTALGIGVGLILGFVLLICLKTISFSVPEGQVAASSASSMQSSTMELPGYSIWLFQVGSFSDQAAADRQSADLKSKGINVAMRGSNPIQLVAGVAGAKVTSSTLIDILKQKSIDFYLKPITVEPQTITVSGLSQSDSTHLKTQLDAMMGEAKTNIASIDSSAPTGSSNSAAQIPGNSEVQLLQKAGHRQAAADLQLLAGSFQQAETVWKAGKTLDGAATLSAEQHLAEFYAAYDRLVQDLQAADK